MRLRNKKMAFMLAAAVAVSGFSMNGALPSAAAAESRSHIELDVVGTGDKETGKEINDKEARKEISEILSHKVKEAENGIVSGDYTYVVQEDGTAELAKYNGSDTAVDIPADIDGHKVTVIGESCFEDSGIEMVYVPGNVKRIGDYAFDECVKMEYITIGEGVEEIGKAAFFSCTRLGDVQIPEKVKSIGDGAFYDNRSLEQISFGGNLEEIGQYVFGKCTKLEDIYFCQGNGKIGDLMFVGCSGLKSVTVPDGFTEIGRKAFDECENLRNVEIADTVGEIKESAFSGTNLQSISFYGETIGDNAFSNCANMITADLGDSLVSIGEGAFFRTKIRTVDIPATTTEIGEKAFGNCSCKRYKVDAENEAFESVDGVLYNEEMTEIIGYPMRGKAEEFIVPDSVEKIGTYCFAGNNTLKDISLGNGIREIGKYAFSEMESMEECIIPEGVEELGEGFLRNSGVKAVEIPGSVEEIPCLALYGCFSLEELTIGDGVKTLSDGALGSNDALAKIELPKSIEKISSVFLGDAASIGNVKEISISPENGKFKSEGNDIYSKDGKELVLHQGRPDEESLVIRDGVEKIDDGALFSSEFIREVTLPASVKEIGKEALGFVSVGFYAEKIANFILKGPGDGIGVEYARENNFAYFTDVPAFSLSARSLKCGESAEAKITNVAVETVFLSADDNVVEVDPHSGKITAVGKGETKVYAFAGDVYFEQDIEVVDGSVKADPWAAYKEISGDGIYAWGDRYYACNQDRSTDILDNPAINCYSGNEYRPIVACQDETHSYVQGVKELYGEDYKQYAIVGRNLSTELSKFVLPESVRLFSGKRKIDVPTFTGTGSTVADLIDSIGRTFTTKTVISTSLSHNVAYGFAGGTEGVVLEFLAPSGNTRGAYISKFSQYEAEYELLLDRGIEVQVVDAGVRMIPAFDPASDAYVYVPEKYMRLKILKDPIEVEAPTATPSATAVPQETEGPVSSAGPSEPVTPTATAVPQETEGPVSSASPSGTPAPAGAEAPAASETPEQTSSPAKPLQKGKTYTDKKTNSKVKISNGGKLADGRVTGAKAVYVKQASKNKKAAVPDTVEIDGVSVSVTEIAAGAFSGDKKVVQVTVGRNVVKIGKNAFLNAGNLKKITLKTSKLSAVGKNAIKNINKDAKIIVPKKKRSSYKKKFGKTSGWKNTYKLGVEG